MIWLTNQFVVSLVWSLHKMHVLKHSWWLCSNHAVQLGSSVFNAQSRGAEGIPLALRGLTGVYNFERKVLIVNWGSGLSPGLTEKL